MIRIADLLVPDPPPGRDPVTDPILGVDGRVHYGQVTRRMSGTVMGGVICGVLPLRAIGPRERGWWVGEPSRVCAECGTDRVVV